MALSDDLNSVSAQLEKARDEITGEILDLEGALALAGDQPQEVTDAVAALKQVAQGLDDLVPDISDLPVEPVVAPVEEAPVEEAPVEEAPVEEAPVGDPVEVPVGEPVEDAPVVGQ